MKLEVGMYGRTNYGMIFKIVDNRQVRMDKNIYINVLNNDMCIYVNVNNITKTSNNFIDLIEVGDYVNGYKVTLICEDKVHPQEKCLRIYGHRFVFQDDIKIILTKEQYESNCYIVDNKQGKEDDKGCGAFAV